MTCVTMTDEIVIRMVLGSWAFYSCLYIHSVGDACDIWARAILDNLKIRTLYGESLKSRPDCTRNSNVVGNVGHFIVAGGDAWRPPRLPSSTLTAAVRRRPMSYSVFCCRSVPLWHLAREFVPGHVTTPKVVFLQKVFYFIKSIINLRQR